MAVYSYDCEFLERGPDHPIQVISLGMVASDGRELYLQSRDVDWGFIRHGPDPWLHENVVPYLERWNAEYYRPMEFDPGPWRYRHEFAGEIIRFMDPSRHGEVEKMVAYFGAYDHVVLCQLFGRMIDLPSFMKMWTFDLKQEAVRRGIDWLGRLVPHDEDLDGPEHNALADARWTMRAYRYLMDDRCAPSTSS